MKRKRHTPEQIVRKLREGDRMLNEGTALTEVLRHLEVSESSWARWRAQYGGMKADEAKRLKELERENAATLEHLDRAHAALLYQLLGARFVDGGTAGVRFVPGEPATGGRARTGLAPRDRALTILRGSSSGLPPLMCNVREP